MIRIPDKNQRKRALEAFLRVREMWVRMPGHVMGVTREHIQALEQAQPPIPFEDLSQTARHGPAGTSLQP